jgi:hypothetical protein
MTKRNIRADTEFLVVHNNTLWSSRKEQCQNPTKRTKDAYILWTRRITSRMIKTLGEAKFAQVCTSLHNLNSGKSSCEFHSMPGLCSICYV